ncbi:MAG: glucose-1-phosphate adenylyltransferase, partial [Thermotogae bacterium]
LGENAPNQLDSDVYAGDITVVGMETKIPQGTVVGKNCVIGIGVSESDFESLEIPSGSFVLHKE